MSINNTAFLSFMFIYVKTDRTNLLALLLSMAMQVHVAVAHLTAVASMALDRRGHQRLVRPWRLVHRWQHLLVKQRF